MHAEIIDDVVSAVIVESVDTTPRGLLSFYRDLPGRSPSEQSKRIAATLASLTDDKAMELVRGIVDATIFSLLYLMEVSFQGQEYLRGIPSRRRFGLASRSSASGAISV